MEFDLFGLLNNSTPLASLNRANTGTAKRSLYVLQIFEIGSHEIHSLNCAKNRRSRKTNKDYRRIRFAPKLFVREAAMKKNKSKLKIRLYSSSVHPG